MRCGGGGGRERRRERRRERDKLEQPCGHRECALRGRSSAYVRSSTVRRGESPTAAPLDIACGWGVRASGEESAEELFFFARVQDTAVHASERTSEREGDER